ncbi:MAG: hypothetical protein WCL08_00020 [Verrucomicrobiota bacterium]
MNDDPMSIADRKLCEELESGSFSRESMGRIMAATYVQTEKNADILKEQTVIQNNHTQMFVDHKEMLSDLKKQIHEEIRPAIQEFQRDKRIVLRLWQWALPGVGAMLLAIGAWAWNSGPDAIRKAAYLVKLDEQEIVSQANETATKLDATLETKFAANLQALRYEIKDDTAKSIREHQLWEDTHRTTTK